MFFVEIRNLLSLYMLTTNSNKNMNKISIVLFACMLSLAGVQAQEVKKVLCIGNSFTFYHDSHKRLAEIAESQGHKLDVNAQFVGGYTFHRHLNRDETMSAITYNHFDYVFLQDQSQTPAHLGKNKKQGRLLLRDAAELAERVRCYSPNAKIWIEQTWSYSQGNFGSFGSHEAFDANLKKGTALMAKKAHAQISPIGEAFKICRQERPDINLYDKDNKHQSALGTYLKSCINYLLIFREPFTVDATSCGYDEDSCRYLRGLAERVVLQ